MTTDPAMPNPRFALPIASKLAGDQIHLVGQQLQHQVCHRPALALRTHQPAQNGNSEQQKRERRDQRVLRDRRGVREVFAAEESPQRLACRGQGQPQP